MELVKDIYFNTDKLIENTKVKVSYTGKFYQGNNQKVFIHYGYGKDWNNVNEIEMIKTDLGYQTELNLVGGDTLNFCFKNQNNEWDNNSGKNYIFNIEKQTVNQYGKTTVGTTGSSTTGSFFGKTFGTTEKTTNNGNIFETITTNNPTIPVTDEDITISGIMEDNIIGTPNSIDTIFNPNQAGNINTVETIGNIEIPTVGTTVEPTVIPNTELTNPIVEPVTTNLDNGITQKITYNLDVATPTVTTKWENTKVNIINPVAKALKTTANQAVTITKNTVNKVTTATKNYINQNQKTNQVQTQNSLTVQPTGFAAWTQKVKTTVSKFFSYVPKLISGNYKRNVSNEKK